MTISTSSLDACPILAGMSEAERRNVTGLLASETYSAGEVILREGRSIQILWIIARGRCEVVKNSRNGSEKRLAALEAGGVFGEMSFFSPAPHSASVRAVTDVEVLRLSREEYDRIGQNGSPVAYRIAINAGHVLAERLRRMDEWIAEAVEASGLEQQRDEWREFQQKLYSEWPF